MLSSILLAAEGPNGIHFGADKNEIIWASIAFFVISAILVKVAGPAVKKAMTGRTARIESELADAKAARSAAEQSLAASSADLPDVAVEADAIRTEAADTAARLKVDIVEKAKVEAASLRSRATVDIENSKRQALGDLQDEVARLTRDATEAVVADNLNDSTHGELIESYITQVSQL